MQKNDKCTSHSSCIQKSMANTKKQRLLKPQRRQNLRTKCVKFAANPSIIRTSIDESLVKEELMNEDEMTKTNQWETIVLNYLNRLKGLCGLWRRNSNKNTNDVDENPKTNTNYKCENNNLLVSYSQPFNFSEYQRDSSDEISINDDNSCTPTNQDNIKSNDLHSVSKLNQHIHCISSLYNAENNLIVNPARDNLSKQLKPFLKTRSSTEIEIGKERAIKIVKSAIEYGLASGVLEQNGVDFSFSNAVQNYINQNSSNGANYRFSRTLHPKIYCLQKLGSVSKAVQCRKVSKTSIDINEEINSNKNDDNVIKRTSLPPPSTESISRGSRRSLRRRTINEKSKPNINTSAGASVQTLSYVKDPININKYVYHLQSNDVLLIWGCIIV
ncbi:metacaspase-3-like [Chrysoperla carnea]|uniref:metacaspase-3-like n=1 Tax=Chrysoperla carnea TaxID=189513 RepID=UPI001D07E3A4|nr:metacaspase-3-like [Chrysoperla carnea]